MVFVMKLSQTYVNRLNREWADYLKNKFYNPSQGKYVKLDMSLSDKGLNWKMIGVEYDSGFRINGNGNLRFFIKSKFEKDKRIKNEIEKNAFSGNMIEKSRFLNRPLEKVVTSSAYFIECKIKRIPENSKFLFNNVFGYLMKEPMNIIHIKSRL